MTTLYRLQSLDPVKVVRVQLTGLLRHIHELECLVSISESLVCVATHYRVHHTHLICQNTDTHTYKKAYMYRIYEAHVHVWNCVDNIVDLVPTLQLVGLSLINMTKDRHNIIAHCAPEVFTNITLLYYIKHAPVCDKVHVRLTCWDTKHKTYTRT